MCAKPDEQRRHSHNWTRRHTSIYRVRHRSHNDVRREHYYGWQHTVWGTREGNLSSEETRWQRTIPDRIRVRVLSDFGAALNKNEWIPPYIIGTRLSCDRGFLDSFCLQWRWVHYQISKYIFTYLFIDGWILLNFTFSTNSTSFSWESNASSVTISKQTSIRVFLQYFFYMLLPPQI